MRDYVAGFVGQVDFSLLSSEYTWRRTPSHIYAEFLGRPGALCLRQLRPSEQNKPSSEADGESYIEFAEEQCVPRVYGYFLNAEMIRQWRQAIEFIHTNLCPPADINPF
jgi:hypothetical protein